MLIIGALSIEASLWRRSGWKHQGTGGTHFEEDGMYSGCCTINVHWLINLPQYVATNGVTGFFLWKLNSGENGIHHKFEGGGSRKRLNLEF